MECKVCGVQYVCCTYTPLGIGLITIRRVAVNLVVGLSEFLKLTFSDTLLDRGTRDS